MHHSSVSWEITLLYFFSWNCAWFGLKEPIKVQTKFQTFDCSRKISRNLYFDMLLLLKVYKILAKKIYTEELCLMTLKIDTKFEEKLICCFKNGRNLVNFDPSTWSLKNVDFYWFLLCKAFNVWAKKVQRSYLSWHWRLMQSLMKNWLVVWKMTWGIWQILTRALESVKMGLWWDPFVQSRKCMSLKFTEDLCFMTIKNDTKIEEEMTCCFKIYEEFHQILTRTFESLKNLRFNGLLLTKVYNAWATKTVQRSHLLWHWRVMQNLNKNWLVVWKMTWEIWQIGILMGSFCAE